MQVLKCELCGSNDLVKVDGLFQCQFCGTKYSVEEARKLMGSVTVQGVVETRAADFQIEAGVLKAYHGSSVDVEIPDGVQKIGSGAFRGMAIESVHIPASCETFAMNAFHDCRSLRRFSVDVANPSFAADSQGCLWSKDFSVLLAIPPAVVRVELKPFNQVAFLKPHAEKGLYGTCISANSRACCMRIDEDNFLSSEGTTMMGMDGDIRVPIDKNGIRTIIFPRGMKTIDSNFSGFRDLETVCFPSTLEQVGENALCDCPRLTRIVTEEPIMVEVAHSSFRNTPVAAVEEAKKSQVEAAFTRAKKGDCPRCAAKLRVTATKKVGLLKTVPVVWECDQCGLFMTEGALESPEALIRMGGIAPNFMMFL